jgi:methyl coenzyme M reductase beta subunit
VRDLRDVGTKWPSHQIAALQHQRKRAVQILVPEVLRGAIAKLGSNENAASTADACRRVVTMKERGLSLVLSPGRVLAMREIRRSVRGLVDHQVSWEVLGKGRRGTVQVRAAWTVVSVKGR